MSKFKELLRRKELSQKDKKHIIWKVLDRLDLDHKTFNGGLEKLLKKVRKKIERKLDSDDKITFAIDIKDTQEIGVHYIKYVNRVQITVEFFLNGRHETMVPLTFKAPLSDEDKKLIQKLKKMNRNNNQEDYKEQINELSKIFNVPKRFMGKDDNQQCMHYQCPKCNGTGITNRGEPCVRYISCPCSNCNATF